MHASTMPGCSWFRLVPASVLCKKKYLTQMDRDGIVVRVSAVDIGIASPQPLVSRVPSGSAFPSSESNGRIGLTLVFDPQYGRPVAPPQPLRPSDAPSAAPRDLHSHAMDNIEFIRQTMENAGSFTAISGMGQIAIGLSALAASSMAARQATPSRWLGVWLVEAIVAVIIGYWGISRKARATGVSLNSGPTRKFLICFAPPLIGGAVLTAVLYGAARTDLLPGTWLLMFGTAVVTGGALSVRIVPFMGALFMGMGTAAFCLPTAWGNILMAAGFGGLLILFGTVIARRYGG